MKDMPHFDNYSTEFVLCIYEFLLNKLYALFDYKNAK